MGADLIFLVCVLITQLHAGNPVGTATGFFYTKNDGLYLVTNRHVVLGRNERMPDILRLSMHLSEQDLTQNTELDIHLYQNSSPLYQVHPNSPTIDIAVIELDKQDIMSRFYLKALSSQNFLSQVQNVV